MMVHEDFNPEGIENLRAAVVQQACYDYLSFLHCPDRKIKVKYNPKTKRTTYETKKSLEKWFRSKEFTRTFCSVSGQKIMDQLKSNHAHGFRLFSEEQIEKLEKQRLQELG